ncbi:hypothetical protein QZH41_016083 [Actinostola sp. cb2023]|nr:hypothetical protein QZH41_016083 [Actinostola sp. cb2023]
MLCKAQDQELLTNKDNTFIIGFPAQVQLNPANMGVNRLYLTADENTEAFIQIPSIKENKIARLHPGGTMVVDLPGKVRMPSKTGLEVKRGIRIYANSSISVYGIDMMQESSDGFLALPLSFLLLGNEYMVMTYPPVMHSVVMVTAALSGTEVTFILKLSLAGSVTVNGMVYKSGDSFKISLNAMDSFQLMADSSAGSLTGTRLISNKVMSVYSGNDCANVPLNMSSCDHLVEQMPPISTWGKTFLVKSTAYRKVGDIFHILASQNQTTVRIELSSGPLVVKINAGEYYEFDSPPGSSHVITTSFPSLVVQYGKSHSVDKSKFAPFMSIVPATNQWSNDYTLVVPSALSRNFQCFANLVVSARETKNIETKSISPVHKLTWTSVPFTLYSTATVNLTSGQYRFYHKSPLKVFSVMFLCNADFEAFGFPAGLRLFRRSLSCTSRPMVPGDRRDNDCDDRADEELLNGIDDDGDGKIDEDLATPIPVIQAPASVNETECYIPSMRMASTPKHQAFGMCNVRGNLKIFYKDVSLPNLVDVDASVTLKDVVYSESLGNKQSEDFDSLAAIMKRELTEVFKNITGFQGINILGFRNGSVKVIFRVVIKKQNKDENPQVIVNKVGQHLAVSVKGGKLGDYEVVPTVELREKPPPPNKPQASEIKESTVHIEWDPPDLSIMFAISGYLLQYKQFGHVTWMTYDTVKGDNHRIDGLDAGTGYLIRTKSQNKYGHSKPSGILEITTLDKSLGGAEIALIIIIPIIVIITCVAVAWFFYKKRRKSSGSKRSNSDHPLLGNGVVRYSHPAEKIHIDENHKWKEISRDFMELGRILGEGEFGLVMEGKLTQEDGSVIRCAVKKLKRTATESDMKDLLNELDIMVQVGSHPNIVNLIGACAFGGPIMVVVEFAANGNLLLHLQKQSSRRYEDMAEYQIHIAPKQRLKIAGDVANGMAHLARRRCVHRDLAARNVLLDENWTAKVSDFGLSRDVYTDSVYEKTTGGKLPAKWMAIEALEAGLNTTQSDV